jgi:hypothetical protein
MLSIAIDYRKYYWLTRTTLVVPGKTTTKTKHEDKDSSIAVRTKADSNWDIMAHLDSSIPHSTNLDDLTSPRRRVG